MTQDTNPESDRITELHADLATVGLPRAERANLTMLLQTYPHLQTESLEFAAALIDRALDPGPHPPMPPKLHDQVLLDSMRYFAAFEPPIGPASNTK